MISTDTTCLTIFTVTHVMLPPHNILPSHIFDLMIDIEKQSLLGKINVKNTINSIDKLVTSEAPAPTHLRGVSVFACIPPTHHFSQLLTSSLWTDLSMLGHSFRALWSEVIWAFADEYNWYCTCFYTEKTNWIARPKILVSKKN